MNKTELLKYCYFFKDEKQCPQSYDGKHEGKLWQAEKMICEYMTELVHKDNPRESMANAIAMYIEKWSPYKYLEVMDIYFEKCPT